MEPVERLIEELKLCVDENFEPTHSISSSFHSYLEKNKGKDLVKKDCLKIFDAYPLTDSFLENKRVKLGTVEFSYIYSAINNRERRISLIQAFLSVIEKDRDTRIVKKEFGIVIEALPTSETVVNRKQPTVESVSSSEETETDETDTETDSEELSPEIKGLLMHIFNNLQNVNKSKEEYIQSLPVPDGVHLK